MKDRVLCVRLHDRRHLQLIITPYAYSSAHIKVNWDGTVDPTARRPMSARGATPWRHDLCRGTEIRLDDIRLHMGTPPTPTPISAPGEAGKP